MDTTKAVLVVGHRTVEEGRRRVVQVVQVVRVVRVVRTEVREVGRTVGLLVVRMVGLLEVRMVGLLVDQMVDRTVGRRRLVAVVVVRTVEVLVVLEADRSNDVKSQYVHETTEEEAEEAAVVPYDVILHDVMVMEPCDHRSGSGLVVEVAVPERAVVGSGEIVQVWEAEYSVVGRVVERID